MNVAAADRQALPAGRPEQLRPPGNTSRRPDADEPGRGSWRVSVSLGPLTAGPDEPCAMQNAIRLRLREIASLSKNDHTSHPPFHRGVGQYRQVPCRRSSRPGDSRRTDRPASTVLGKCSREHGSVLVREVICAVGSGGGTLMACTSSPSGPGNVERAEISVDRKISLGGGGSEGVGVTVRIRRFQYFQDGVGGRPFPGELRNAECGRTAVRARYQARASAWHDLPCPVIGAIHLVILPAGGTSNWPGRRDRLFLAPLFCPIRSYTNACSRLRRVAFQQQGYGTLQRGATAPSPLRLSSRPGRSPSSARPRTPAASGAPSLWNLISSPFGGTVFPVNPKRPSVLGIKAYPGIEAVPEPWTWP